MKLIQIIDEDFINYKKIALYVGFPTCTFKCDIDCGQKICQNRPLMDLEKIEVSVEYVVNRYLENDIVQAITMGGLEPLDSINDLQDLILGLRAKTDDDIVVYTGYKPDEPISLKFKSFVSENGLKNIIVKFGRFVLGHKPHYDPVLGVKLASDDQFGVRL